MTLGFNVKYLLLATITLVIEICIALFVKDRIVRPFVGDVLVIILIYCFLRIVLNITYWKAAVGVFLFACVIEILQYFDYVRLLHLETNRVLSVMMGRTFEWSDFAAYLTGFLIIILTEKFFHRGAEN
jgi:hypothetical protein